MPRHADPRKQELLKLLGVEGTKKNYTLAELEELWVKRQANDKEEAEAEALAKLLGGNVPLEEETFVPVGVAEHQAMAKEDPFNGLTDHQKSIARMSLRGLSQLAIANVLGISQPRVSKELATVRAFQEARGAGLNQAAVIGEATTFYEEIEYQAWMTYQLAKEPGDKAKLLDTAMKARMQHTKLLMDVGLVRKAGTEIKHTLEVSPFIQAWKEKEAKEAGDSLVSLDFKALPEPARDEIVDAVFEDSTDDNEVEITELEEPTLEIEE